MVLYCCVFCIHVLLTAVMALYSSVFCTLYLCVATAVIALYCTILCLHALLLSLMALLFTVFCINLLPTTVRACTVSFSVFMRWFYLLWPCTLLYSVLIYCWPLSWPCSLRWRPSPARSRSVRRSSSRNSSVTLGWSRAYQTGCRLCWRLTCGMKDMK